MRLWVSIARRTCGVSCRSSSPGAQWISSSFETKASTCAHYTQVRSARRRRRSDDYHPDAWFRGNRLGDRLLHSADCSSDKGALHSGHQYLGVLSRCAASLLFLIHATVIRDAVFVVVQTVNLVAGGLIVAFCKRYEGEVCPFHRNAHSGPGHTGHQPHRSRPSWELGQVASAARCPSVNCLSERHEHLRMKLSPVTHSRLSKHFGGSEVAPLTHHGTEAHVTSDCPDSFGCFRRLRAAGADESDH